MNRSEPVNQVEFRVVGLSRSGNHAVIHWMRRQAEGRVCFVNCAEPKTNPFLTARPMGDGQRALANFDEFDLDAEASGNWTKKNLLIYSYEDCFLSTVCHRDFERQHDAFVGPSGRRLDLLVLRDPFNLFASRLKSEYGGVTWGTAVRIWKQHARQFLGQRNYVTQQFVPISFNRWMAQREYREQLAERLGLRFSDAGVTVVPRTGGGSSFDSTQFDGRAHQMDLTGRWRHFQDDADYCRLFDREVLQMCEAIFGEVEPSEEFRRFRDRCWQQIAAGE